MVLKLLTTRFMTNHFLTSIRAACMFSCLGVIQCIKADSNLSNFNHAERLFSEGLYEEAYPLYQNREFSSQTPLLLIRQAECLLEKGEFLQAAERLADSQPLSSQTEENQRLYLLAISYRHMKRYHEALSILNSLSSDSLKEEILLEKGLNYYCLNEFEQAYTYFKSISQQTIEAYIPAQMYLAKIALIQSDSPQAFILLNALDPVLHAFHPLQFEISYLKGLSAFLQRDYAQASSDLAKALKKKSKQAQYWQLEASYYLAASDLMLARQVNIDHKDREKLFEQAEEALHLYPSSFQEEKFYLLELELYLTWSQINPTISQKSLQLLTHLPQLSLEKSQQLDRLKSDFLLSDSERTRYYHQLVSSHALDPQAWYLQGMNHFLLSQKSPLYHPLLADAILDFDHAYHLYDQKGKDLEAAFALKYLALTSYLHKTPKVCEQSWELLNTAIEKKRIPAAFLDEIAYLAMLLAVDIQVDLEKTKTILLKVRSSPSNQWKEQIEKLQGILLYNHKRIDEAEEQFNHFLIEYPSSFLIPEIYSWKAKCAEDQKQEEKRKTCLKQIFLSYPNHLLAAHAYFNYYPYHDYAKGNRKAIKHLQSMPKSFPSHPLSMVAFYLVGLDCQKNHLNENGKIEKHQNLSAAIEFFQQGEQLFDQIKQAQSFSSHEMEYFTQVRHRCQLERALTNLTIANQSQQTKKDIYLSYAEEVFNQLNEELHRTFSPSYLDILEETEFWLMQTYLKQNKEIEAHGLLSHMLEHYRQLGQTQGYFLSRVWYEKGQMALKKQDYQQALQDFLAAEQTAFGLNPHQKIDLWIQQSLCYKEKGQYDEAICLLSKAINDEAISPLRFKAMFLRAEMYEQQGKPELALKQLEAIIKKGGKWGDQAKEKLKQTYGYF